MKPKMHKWTVLTILLIAVVAASNVEGRRVRSRLFRMVRPESTAFQMPSRQNMMPAPPVQSFGRGFAPGFNMPAYNMPMPMMGGRGYIPDGDYISAHGTTSVDGGDISFDAHSDYIPIGMMG